MGVNQVMLVNGSVVINNVFKASGCMMDVLMDLLVLFVGEICGGEFV